MEAIFWDYFNKYGYYTLLVGTALDHTGTPTFVIFGAVAAGNGKIQLLPVLIYSFIGAQISDAISYGLGRYFGRPLVIKYGRHIHFGKEKLIKAELFLEKNSTSVIVWGRFLAIISRYIPFACGVLKIDPARYFLYTTVGNTLMILSYGYLCFIIGEKLKSVFNNSFYLMLLSVLIILFHLTITLLIRKYHLSRRIIRRTER